MWHRELTRYHWFVLIVAALGWLFDTMDQQLFNLARIPAMNELLAPAPGQLPDRGEVNRYAGITTAIFLIGWATGGLFFGVLGDRIGRAKTMMLTILAYSLCTGLSALSTNVWDFCLYRFLTGLGVGGEFAVGVSLVAEVMPRRARPFALGLLQALSAVGNIMAALISIGLGHLEESGVLGQWQLAGITITAWRAMFVVGTLPALLALIIRRRLKEPERWQAISSKTADDEFVIEGHVVHSGKQQAGSYAELLGDARWRRRALVGLVMATSGVIGVWGIGFFSIDLNRSVLRKVFEQELRDSGAANLDRDALRLLLADPSGFDQWAAPLRPTDLLNSSATVSDAQPLLTAMLTLHQKGESVEIATLLDSLDQQGQTESERAHRLEYLSGVPESSGSDQLSKSILDRSKEQNGRMTRWAGYTSMMLNIGAFFGIYGFSMLTHHIGRKPAFAVSYIAAGLSTALVFACLNDITDVFWMIPLMGFCLLSLFGGYAIYFPELFPTRLRSTGTSFCYNVGRFIAASGPFTLGLLTSEVFASYSEPMRWAGVSMCSVFLLGLAALPFAPETHGEDLPE
ncbi:MAG: MFS transporter [Planctomycetaceae bacterium]|nr:MFS transporter [Planctomycetaceae bacterium]